MLAIKDVSIEAGPADNPRMLLTGVSVSYPLAHFGAIVGPSGCGKTSLLKAIAGVAPGREEGEIWWKGRNLANADFHASEIAYVPQFGIAYPDLTARENVRFSLDLRVRHKSRREREAAVDRILDEVGAQEFQHQPAKTLSGGQRRRLTLAMELTSRPEILLCDEVTSGLDPRSENEVMLLLKSQSTDAGRLVLFVTHSLEHLELYDSVLVLCGGAVAYHGPPSRLAHYFGVENPEHLYARLNSQTAEEWAALWQEHAEAFGAATEPDGGAETEETGREPLPDGQAKLLPGPLHQFRALLIRRALIFSRGTPQVLVQLAFIFGFPLLVALFAWNGLPSITNLSMGLGTDSLAQSDESRTFLAESSKLGGLVSGLVMFQVILLTLMGANNSGREIAAERQMFEQEKLSGLSPLAYVGSKAVFLFFLVSAQSLWMGLFVHQVCGFPGELPAQLGYLLLVNAAMTAICLAVSGTMRSPEQASLVSIYLVGFQLPLSGAVLALPEPFGSVIRPVISAYWGWSGILETLHLERCYDIVRTVVPSTLATPAVCVWVLCAHIVAGLAVAWMGCERRHAQ